MRPPSGDCRRGWATWPSFASPLRRPGRPCWTHGRGSSPGWAATLRPVWRPSRRCARPARMPAWCSSRHAAPRRSGSPHWRQASTRSSPSRSRGRSWPPDPPAAGASTPRPGQPPIHRRSTRGRLDRREPFVTGPGCTTTRGETPGALRAYARQHPLEGHILERVWGPGHAGDPRTINVHVRWLRSDRPILTTPSDS